MKITATRYFSTGFLYLGKGLRKLVWNKNFQHIEIFKFIIAGYAGFETKSPTEAYASIRARRCRHAGIIVQELVQTIQCFHSHLSTVSTVWLSLIDQSNDFGELRG